MEMWGERADNWRRYCNGTLPLRSDRPEIGRVSLLEL